MAINTTALNTNLKSSFKTGIVEFFTKQMGNSPNVSIDAAAQDLADRLADALTTNLDTWIKTATVTVGTGIPVTTAGTAAAQTGTTTAPGVGDPNIGTGGLS